MMSVLGRSDRSTMNSLKRSLSIPLAVAMSAFGAIVPVGVGATLSAGASASAFCDPHVAPGVVQGRGGDLREPDTGQVHEDMPASAKGKAGKKFKATVPVYFHVVTDGAIGAVTSAQINAQIAVLNNTYSAGEGGAATGFSFTLAGVTRTDNADWFYGGIGGTNEHSMKQALHQGGTNALNWYSTTAGAYLGWAYLPDIVTKPGQAYLDGVVVDWESMLGTSTTYAGRYDQGETGTHEVGHWLNLEHTFYGGCNANGDFVDDTPAQKIATNGCPEGQDSCKAPGLDPIHNYMDYSYDTCYTEFTAGQVQRMRDAWLFWRA
jgi:Pregnancy-associated plasma protein-A